MNTQHGKMLKAVFSKPTPSTLEWARIEAVLVAAGCVGVEGPVLRERLLRTGQDDRPRNMIAFAMAALELLEQAINAAPDAAPVAAPVAAPDAV